MNYNNISFRMRAKKYVIGILRWQIVGFTDSWDPAIRQLSNVSQ